MQDNLKEVAFAVCVLTVGPLSLFAMPTAKEIDQVRPVIESLMKDDLARMRQGKCKASEVGESAVVLAKAADTQAAKYYLLTSALPYFAKDGKYDRVLAALDDIKAMIPDMPTKDLIQLVEPIVLRAPKTDASANRLLQMVEDYRAREKSEAKAERMRQAIAKNPADKSLHTKLAEYMAVVGNWQVALTEFAQGDNREAARIAKSEQSVGGVANVNDVANFWWEYAEGRAKPVQTAIRQHAVELYRAGIAEGKITGLTKVQAERRIASELAAGAAPVRPAVAANGGTARKPSVQSSSASDLKAEGNRILDLGCERKLELIACPAGSFTMGVANPEADEVRAHQVKITRPFWLGKFPVTREQWTKVMYGECPSRDEDPQYDFAALNSHIKRKEQFMGWLNKKFAAQLPKGYVFRLPTEAELAYAMTSGGREAVTEASVGVLGPTVDDKEAIIRELSAKGAKLSKAGSDRPTKVGTAKPNAWGFYDIVNNGEPLVLDLVAPDSKTRNLKIDDKGRVLAIGYEDVETDPLCWDKGEADVKSLCGTPTKFWGRRTIGEGGYNETFRVCLGPDLVAEKKAKK